jgi:uncharacterized phage protein (TIGR01671 family)
MREIKFRAWSTKYKYMVYGINITNGDMGYYPKLKDKDGQETSIDFDDQFNDGDNPVLMQFTGLKDKNGKEIYESDIVKCTSTYKTNCVDINIVKRESYSFQPFAMYENEPGWYLKVGDCLEKRRMIEVIGNIYENPNLIK